MENQLLNEYQNLQQANTKVNGDYTSDNFLSSLRGTLGTLGLRNNINFFRHNGRGHAPNNICNSINLLQVPSHWQLIFVTDEPLGIPNRRRGRRGRRGRNTSASFGMELDLSKGNIEEQKKAYKLQEENERKLQEETVSSASFATNLRRGTVNSASASASASVVTNRKKITKQQNNNPVTRNQKQILTNFLNNKLRNYTSIFPGKKKKNYKTLRDSIYLLRTKNNLTAFIKKVDNLINKSKRQERKNQWKNVKHKLQGGNQFINIRGKGKRKIRYSTTGKKYVILGGKKNYKIFR
jgi:hypothetical protein